MQKAEAVFSKESPVRLGDKVTFSRTVKMPPAFKLLTVILIAPFPETGFPQFAFSETGLQVQFELKA